jgi:tetratricopeptide (TPR) repeat protein
MSGNQQAFQNAMNNGHSAAWEQAWDQAARFYRQALEEFPDDTGAITSLGLALFELKEYTGAQKQYQRASTLTPEDPLPLEKLSQIYEATGETKKAVQTGIQAAELRLKGRDVEKSINGWQKVLALEPDNRTARTRLALIYEKLGRSKEAVNEYLALASVLQHGGEGEKARQLVQYCFQLVPGSGEAQTALSVLKTGQMLPKASKPRLKTGTPPARETKPALAAGKASAILDPVAEALQAAMVQLADALFEQAEEGASAATARRGLSAISRGSGLDVDTSSRQRILLHLGQAIDSQTKQEFSQAAAEMERAVEIGLNRPAAFFDLGYLQAEKDPQKAMRHLQKSVKHPDFALASQILLAQIQYRQAAFTEAAGHYLQALRLADSLTAPAEHAETLRQLYEPVIEMQTRQTHPEALKNLCDTISGQLMRADWRAFLSTARAQLPQQAEGSPPLPLAEMLLESRSGQVIEAQATVRSLANQGLLRSAMEEAFYALQYAPTYLPLHIQIGELLLAEGQQQAAIEKFMLISDLYNLRGESNQAIQLLRRVVELAPMDLTVRNRLIAQLVERGRVDDAIGQYVQVADMYYRMADLDTARQTYLAALRQAQGSTEGKRWAEDILNKVADIDLQRIDYRNAVRTFEQLRSLKPEDTTVRMSLIGLNFKLKQDNNALAELDGFLSLLGNSKRRAEAIEFLETMVSDHPDKIELRRRLAELYRLNGQLDAAVAQMDTIADLMMTAGNLPGARKVVEAIIALNPPNVQQFRDALKQLG